MPMGSWLHNPKLRSGAGSPVKLLRVVRVLNREMLIGMPLPCRNVVCGVLSTRRSPFGERTDDEAFQADCATVVGEVSMVDDDCCDLKEKMPSPAISTTMITVNASMVVPTAVL